MGKGWLFVLLMCCMAFPLPAQQRLVVVEGLVTDSITGETLPNATIQLKGAGKGCVTNLNGRFSLSVPEGSITLVVSFVGYDSRELHLQARQRRERLRIPLAPSSYALSEVMVKPKREKYKKKGNPAVELLRHLIERREQGDPKAQPWYAYDQYEKIMVAKNDYTPKEKKPDKKGRFDFLAEFVDTLDNGVTILPVMEKEKMQRVYHRRSPAGERTLLQGYRSSGLDEIVSGDGVQQVLNEVFREVNLFSNDIPLFLQRFVSPLSSIGPDYYKYYLMDTLMVDNQQCVDLGFVPRNSETFGFTGHLYVTLDSTYFVKKAHLSVPKDINLNFVSQLSIEQTFERNDEQLRILTKDDIKVVFKLTDKSKGFFARRLNIYSNPSFTPPEEKELALFANPNPVIEQEQANRQPDSFWVAHRPAEAVNRNPKTMEQLMAQLNEVPLFRTTKQVLSVMFNGYISTHREPEKSLFEFGPMNSTINSNTLEGTRFRVGGTTTPYFSPHLFLDGYMAYGTKDERLKYDALVEYSFNKRKVFRKEFPIHSLRLEYMYDINKLGQEYMYTSKDNMMLMLRRQEDRFITYLRQADLAYYREHYNGLAYGATLRNRRESTSPLIGFERIGQGREVQPVGHYDMTTLELKLRYAYKEKFFQTRNTRIPITYDAWILNLSHVMGWKGLLGSDYDYQRTDFGVQKRLWFSAFGYMDLILKGGKVWSQVPYPLLILPNANMSYTIQPEAYTNLNALEFINDEYLSWDVTYYLNGNLMNRLPLLKKLKWREVFCLRGLWGHLSTKNDPASQAEGLYRFPDTTYRMGRTPYMEASVGFENIFKCLRIDYVWRLNYLHHADIQKNGVRMTMVLFF